MPVIANMTLKTMIGMITGIVNPFQVRKKGWMVVSTSGKLPAIRAFGDTLGLDTLLRGYSAGAIEYK